MSQDKKDSGADLIEAQYKNICAFMGMRFVGLCFASSEKQPVSKNKKALATAQALGKKAGKW